MATELVELAVLLRISGFCTRPRFLEIVEELQFSWSETGVGFAHKIEVIVGFRATSTNDESNLEALEVDFAYFFFGGGGVAV